MSLAALCWSDIKLGTVGEWIAGIGALAAVAVALLMRHWDIRKAERERHLERARKVTAWVAQGGDEPGWRMFVRNAGDDAIYRWFADISWVRAGDGGLAAVACTHISDVDGPLPPRRTRSWPVAEPTPDQDRRSRIILVMSFQDARSHLWRYEDGTLDDLGRVPFSHTGSFFGSRDRIRAVQDGDPNLAV